MSAATTIPPRPPKIDARAAAQAAAAYFKDLYPNVEAYSLEEVELSEDRNYWLITLSFEIPSSSSSDSVMMQFRPPKTKFKVFKVDAKNARVMAMKIRNLE